jgi:hypothetical protein
VGPQGPQGNQGPQGVPGSQGITGIAGVQYITGAPVTIPRSTAATASAACPAGKSVINGGFTVTLSAGSTADLSDMIVTSSVFTGPTGWSATGSNTAKANNSDLVLTAYAVCAIVQ